MEEVSGQFDHQNKWQIDLLVADYQACREDERGQAPVIATAFSIAVTLIGVMAAAVTQTCEFSRAQSCVRVPDYILAASPLIPIALLAYVTMLGINATLRTFYMRGLEERIQRYSLEPIMGELMAFSYTGMTMQAVSLRRGRVSFRILANLMFAAVIVIFGGYTAYVGFHVKEPDQLVMGIVYSCAALILVWAVAQGTVRGRALFTEAAENFLTDPKNRNLPRPMRKHCEDNSNERPLASYLAFPRPEDWIKWVITPGVFAVAAWSTEGFSRWSTFLALWLTVEYLIYSARYQWNDVRGVIEDQAEGNRRLPVGPGGRHLRRNVAASLSVGALRLTTAVVLGIILRLTLPIFLLIVFVFAIAIAYEILRSPKPVPISQNKNILQKLPGRVIAIWCVVGLGYGVRSGVGLIIGGIPVASWKFTVGVLLFIAFGIMFVAMTWVLAATDYCEVSPEGTWRWQPGKDVKSHIALFLRYVPKLKNDLTVDPSKTIQEPLRNSGPYTLGRLDPILIKYNSFRTPWNLAFFASIILGSLLGPGLAHAQSSLMLDILVLSVSLAGAFLMIRSTSQKNRANDDKLVSKNRTAMLLIGICATGALLIVCAATLFSSFPKALITAIPWLAVALVYFIFCYSSYQDTKDFARQLQSAFASLREVKLLPKLVIRGIIGKKTSDAIETSNQNRPEP